MAHADELNPVRGGPDGVLTLPENATAEEKDLHWFTHVYQGDRMPQFTFRATIMGGLIGMAMCCAHLYTVLAIGWSFGVAITACVMSYVIWNVLRALSGNHLTPMSILENNCMQSTASAAGYSTGSTMATCFGALLLITGAHIEWYYAAAFTLVTGAMGVWLAIPMKRQMINHEQLKFPSGIAAAETLRSLYSHGAEALRKAYSLIIALFAGVIIGFLKVGDATLNKIWFLKDFYNWSGVGKLRLPDQLPHDGWYKLQGKGVHGLGFDISGLLIAAGIIIGPRVCLSMLAGSMLLYFVIGPWLNSIDVANAGVEGYLRSIPLHRSGAFFQFQVWGLWGGTAVMVFASLTSVALQWKTLGRAFNIFRRSPESQRVAEQMKHIEVPTSWFIGGLIPIMIAMLAVQYLAFHIDLWLGIIAVAMSFVLTLVAARSTGETDTTPTGAMGKVMQLLFGALSPGNINHNLVSAGVAANSASAGSDLLMDLKSGYLLGANPRKQFLAQFVGLIFGTIAIVPCWYLMIPDKATLETYAAPATNQWRAVAELLTKGVDQLPHSARWAILIGALVGILLPIVERAVPATARRYYPSAMRLGLSWIIYHSNALAFAVGACFVWAWNKFHKKSCETYSIPIASGLIAGESLMLGLLAMLATAMGLLAAK